MRYAIVFDVPDAEPFYAGEAKGALGFAPTLASALTYADEVTALRVLVNGYGSLGQEYGSVVEVSEVAA